MASSRSTDNSNDSPGHDFFRDPLPSPELERQRLHYEDEYWSEPPVMLSAYSERQAALHVGNGTKPQVEFTPQRKDLYLRWLQVTGLKALSAARAGVSESSVTTARKNDPLFAELEVEAKELHTDSLVQEAQRRAVRGVTKPLIGGKFKDEIVTYVVEYSDRLMEVLLRAGRGEFRGEQSAAAKEAGGVMIIPGGPMSAEEWEAQYGEAAKGKSGADPLPGLDTTQGEPGEPKQ